jgi:signal transduction histidine kinase
VSLLLGGAVTWVLVRDLEVQGVQDQLDRAVITAASLVRHQECLYPPLASSAVPANCPLDDPVDFQARLSSITPLLNTYRLILLDRKHAVVYDSGSAGTSGVVIGVVPSRRVANVGEARTSLDGQGYIAAAVPIAFKRQLDVAYVMLALPQGSITTAAAGDLAARLLEAGGAALLVAMLLILLVSRSLTAPLAKLAGAAEDIAAGHYSRRVGIRGQDEIGKLGSAFDRMAEAVERARRTQHEFLTNVSHELKTPLTSLIGFSQALVDGSLVDETERSRAATIIHEESERVLRMAQELLDLARVEADSISMHITAVDLGGQLQQELEIVRPRADGRGLALELSVPADIPPVAADPERLHQILANLLDNAVKYAPDGSTIHALARLSDGTIETVVSNPAGVHRPDPDRMFDRFYRADPSRSAAAGGVGLGLAISRELAAAMRGRLWADFANESGDLRLHLQLPPARVEAHGSAVEAASKSS